MTSEMLSQEEIDALLKGNDETYNKVHTEDLNETEKDALGEIGNISMGTAATTLFTLLGQKVLITTPKVEIITTEKLASEYPKPFVAVDVKYKMGLVGSNLLILKVEDVKVITDLMMGGNGTNIDRELNEMDLSAISEAMNQMVGSSSTSLSEIFSKKIDIEPPRSSLMQFNEPNIDFDMLNTNDLVKVSFRMVVGDIIDSEIMQLLPLEFAKSLVNGLLNKDMDLKVLDDEEVEKTEDYSKIDMNEDIHYSDNNSIERLDNDYSKDNHVNQSQVNVKKAEFQSFDKGDDVVYNESIDLIQDIPIEITVELGRTTRKISEILEYGPGTIIELDKVVGEPLEIFANGKFIAKGEVVVIDDNFGIRITDIISPSKRVGKF